MVGYYCEGEGLIAKLLSTDAIDASDQINLKNLAAAVI